MHEVEALTMMNRLDYDRYSFNFMEREFHYYYDLFKHWLCVFGLDLNQILLSAVIILIVFMIMCYISFVSKEIYLL